MAGSDGAADLKVAIRTNWERESCRDCRTELTCHWLNGCSLRVIQNKGVKSFGVLLVSQMGTTRLTVSRTCTDSSTSAPRFLPSTSMLSTSFQPFRQARTSTGKPVVHMEFGVSMRLDVSVDREVSACKYKAQFTHSRELVLLSNDLHTRGGVKIRRVSRQGG